MLNLSKDGILKKRELKTILKAMAGEGLDDSQVHIIVQKLFNSLKISPISSCSSSESSSKEHSLDCSLVDLTEPTDNGIHFDQFVSLFKDNPVVAQKMVIKLA